MVQKSVYSAYMNLFKRGHIITGFSQRFPDYGVAYWLDQLEDALKLCKKGRFLDVGAGDGRLSVLLSNLGFTGGDAIEIDVNKKVWDQNLKFCPQLSLHRGLLQNLMPKLKQQKKYDFIMLAEVFEHIPLTDVKEFLSCLGELLADDGVIFLTTPNGIVQGPAEKSSMWHEVQPWGHHKHYKPKELCEMFEQAGYSIVKKAFECHTRKTQWYNKFFYPVARFDQKAQTTRKYSKKFRDCYRLFSLPAVCAVKIPLLMMANYLRAYQSKNNSEKNCDTQILILKKL